MTKTKQKSVTFKKSHTYNSKAKEGLHEQSKLFLNEKRCCFAQHWQYYLKYVVKRLFVEFLLSDSFEEYFAYLNTAQEYVDAPDATLPGLYQFEAMYSAIIFMQLKGFDNIDNFDEQGPDYYHYLAFCYSTNVFNLYNTHNSVDNNNTKNDNNCDSQTNEFFVRSKRLEYLHKEYRKFLCSFFFMFRYVALTSNTREVSYFDEGLTYTRLLIKEIIDDIPTLYHVEQHEILLNVLVQYIENYGGFFNRTNGYYEKIDDLISDCCAGSISSDCNKEYYPHYCDFRVDLTRYENDPPGSLTGLSLLDTSNYYSYDDVSNNNYVTNSGDYPLNLKTNRRGLLSVTSNNDAAGSLPCKNLVVRDSLQLSKKIGECDTSRIARGNVNDLVPSWKRYTLNTLLNSVKNRKQTLNNESIMRDEEVVINAVTAKQPMCFPGTMNCPHYKYYQRRYELFSKFAENIRLDSEGWYSVTPEVIADHTARLLATKFNSIIDGFAGCGGNCIQFAKYMDRVVAIDIDKQRLDFAKNNARVYGVEQKIDFVHGNFFTEITNKSLSDINCIFLSPPWGGIDYSKHLLYKIDELLYGRGNEMIAKAFSVTPNLCLCLPRNIDLTDVFTVASLYNLNVEVELNYQGTHHIMTTVLFGDCSRV